MAGLRVERCPTVDPWNGCETAAKDARVRMGRLVLPFRSAAQVVLRERVRVLSQGKGNRRFAERHGCGTARRYPGENVIVDLQGSIGEAPDQAPSSPHVPVGVGCSRGYSPGMLGWDQGKTESCTCPAESRNA
jgi:hypothetical protein